VSAKGSLTGSATLHEEGAIGMIDATPRLSRQSIRKPVRHAEADTLILLMLLSFAASVVATRVFLQLTGFPKIGGGDSGLHIAHVLWGGLLLFIATLVPLLWINRWVYPLMAVLSGIGVGLFIDEVGKFITDNNDYFVPVAAPIIYGFFLLTVLLYLQVRRRRRVDTRGELYYVLGELTEALDGDLDTEERGRIWQRLTKIKNTAARPEQARLAQELLDFIHSSQLPVIEYRPNWLEQRVFLLKKWEAQHVTRGRHRALLVAGALLFGLLALYDPLRIALALQGSADPVQRLVELGLLRSGDEMIWLALRLVLVCLVGIALLISAGLLLFKSDRKGSVIGVIGMLFYLLSVNLLVLYFNQFTYIMVTVLEFGFLLGLMRYRSRFLERREPAPLHHQ
jgi:hypothetical protein